MPWTIWCGVSKIFFRHAEILSLVKNTKKNFPARLKKMKWVSTLFNQFWLQEMNTVHNISFRTLTKSRIYHILPELTPFIFSRPHSVFPNKYYYYYSSDVCWQVEGSLTILPYVTSCFFPLKLPGAELKHELNFSKRPPLPL